MKSQQTVGGPGPYGGGHTSGPHRKLHLLGNTQTLSQALEKDSPQRKNNTSQKRVSQLGSGSQTPTNAGYTLGSGRSSKTPTKKSAELVTSPSTSPPPNGQRNPDNGLKSSVSLSQISYSVITTGPSIHHKSYQPVLKKEAPIGASKTPGHVRRSTGSGGSFSSILRAGEKNRSNSKQVVIKEQPFNYEERTGKNQRSADNLMTKSQNAPTMRDINNDQQLKDVSKTLSHQYKGMQAPEQLSQIVNITHQTFDRDINLVEVFKDHQGNGSFHLNHADDRDEVRMRTPLDEVSMSHDQQLLIAAIGSGFCHSRLDSGQLWGTGNNTLKGHPLLASGVGGRTDDNFVNSSSYRGYEENKSDIKIIEHEYPNHMGNNTTVEKFEVIREDGDTMKDSFYSPQTLGNVDHRLNSDLKKFNLDDDQYYQPVVSSHQQPNQTAQQQWLQRLQEEHMMFEQKMQDGKKTTQGENQDPITINDLQDTPQAVRERTKSFREQMISDGVSIGTANMFANPSLENLDTQPNPTQNNEKMDPGFLQSNHVHVLSFSEDNPIFNNQDGGFNYASQGSQNAHQQPSNNRDYLLSSLSLNTNQMLGDSRPQSQLVTAENALSQLSQIKLQQQQQSQSQTFTQTSANAVIEMEKNYVILQYESLLQQLSVEFQKLLAKTKETDEHLASQEVLISTQAKIIQDKEAAHYQQEQLSAQLSQQVQDLLGDLEHMTIEKTRREAEDHDQSTHHELLQHQLQSVQSKLRSYESQELCFKEDLEQAMNRVRQAEARMRNKEEEVYQAERDRQAIERDVRNMRETEKSLQMEIDRGNKDRVALEEQMQEARQRAVGDQILIRLRENEIETLSREFKTIKGAFEGIQLNMVSVMRENDQLKAALSDHERNNIQMKSLFQSREQQIGQLESDGGRLKAIIEKERQRSNNLEEDYQRKIEQLQAELRDSTLRREADQISFRKQLDSMRANNQQENIASSIQRYQMAETRQPVQAFSPVQREEPSSIQWLTQHSKPEQSVVPQAQKPFNTQQNRDIYVNPMQNKKPLIQNTSSQNDVMGWNEGQRSQGMPPKLQTSIERTSLSANMFQHYKSQQQLPAQQAANSQFSPRAVSGPTDIQAAGKRSGSDQSPFVADPSQKQQQITSLQNTLSAMQIDKERVENEYRKLGTSKNKQQIERKKEIEFEVEVIDKNIHQIKQRLREMNAF